MVNKTSKYGGTKNFLTHLGRKYICNFQNIDFLFFDHSILMYLYVRWMARNMQNVLYMLYGCFIVLLSVCKNIS